jgi:uncharacterized repeat protein (TIGR01451 family)
LSHDFYGLGHKYDSTFIQKFSANGDEIWKQNLTEGVVGLTNPVHIIKAASDGTFYTTTPKIGIVGNYIWHFSAEGNIIYQFKGEQMQVASDASLYYLSSSIDSFFVNHISSDGIFLWTKAYKKYLTSNYFINVTPANGVLVTYNSSYNSRFHEKYDAFGQLEWIKLDIVNLKIKEQKVDFDNQGNIIIVESLWSNPITPLSDTYLNIVKFSASGQKLFSKTLTSFKKNYSIEVLFGKNGEFFLLNDEKRPPTEIGEDFFYHRPILIKFDSSGVVLPKILKGRVALDDNFNCLVDSLEVGLSSKILKAVKVGDGDYFALLDSLGNYEFEVDTGIYLLSLSSNIYLETCPEVVVVDLTNSPIIAAETNFPVETIISCPFLEVNIAAQTMRRCFQNRYFVQYCNTGTAVAPNAQVTVNLSEDVEFLSSSIPGQNIGSNNWQFPIGAVGEGECGAFTIDFLVVCDSTMLGQTICATAHITPDSICTPLNSDWSGAQVVVDGVCEGDSVRFSIRNIGLGNMTAAQDFIVIEDNIILREGNFNLSPLDSLIIRMPANGSTWRLEAGQEPTFPVANMPSVSVEGCGQNLGGLFSLGFVTQFGEEDGNPFFSRNCEEIIGAYDPNDKSALPKGVADAHFILPNTPIEYQIRFQNTGTDTAFTVIIRDTLSDWMERTSFEPGPSSHPYQVAMQGHGILKFTFDNIRLPDSLVNEATSHGFVRYRITPKNETPLGSVVENRAGIYFDFNAPVMTNTVFHTVDTGFLERVIGNVKFQEVIDNQHFVRVLPNPIRAGAYLFFEKMALEENWFSLYNTFGKTVYQVKFSGDKIRLPEGLPEGNYFFELRNKEGYFGHGRISIF